MASASSPDSNVFPDMRGLKWSPAEKLIARKVFERALGTELQQVMREAQRRAAKLEDFDQLWELEAYLRQSREQIDRKYDYRYSVLPEVFGILISEGRVAEAELQELREDKLHYIRSAARVHSSRRIR